MTASHNRGGMYFRARTIPTDPATGFQIQIRSLLIVANAIWADVLPPAQRDDWQLYASLVTLPGPLGDPITVSGMNMFVRSTVARLQSSLTVPFDAPTTFNTGNSGLVSFTASAGAQTVDVSFDDSTTWANIDDGALLLFLSRPQNPTINFFKGPFRKIDPVLGLTAGPPTPPHTVSVPFTIVEGQRLWLRSRASTPDGRLAASAVIGPIVVAA